MKKVLILGASVVSTRYSYMAMESLINHGHQVVLVSPKYDEIKGHHCYHQLLDVEGKIDVITMYVSPQISSTMINDIIKLSPKVVIFNPGSENPEVYKALELQGIKYLEACTLVLLNTKQFDGIFS